MLVNKHIITKIFTLAALVFLLAGCQHGKIKDSPEDARLLAVGQLDALLEGAESYRFNWQDPDVGTIPLLEGNPGGRQGGGCGRA